MKEKKSTIKKIPKRPSASEIGIMKLENEVMKRTIDKVYNILKDTKLILEL